MPQLISTTDMINDNTSIQATTGYLYLCAAGLGFEERLLCSLWIKLTQLFDKQFIIFIFFAALNST
jgi:hypothetical protein